MASSTLLSNARNGATGAHGAQTIAAPVTPMAGAVARSEDTNGPFVSPIRHVGDDRAGGHQRPFPTAAVEADKKEGEGPEMDEKDKVKDKDNGDNSNIAVTIAELVSATAAAEAATAPPIVTNSQQSSA